MGTQAIEEDYIFFRARFVGIDIYDIPNTCEKTVFIKNIWEKTKNIRNSTNWEELTSYINNICDLLKILKKIYETNIVAVNGLSKNYALNLVTILKTYVFLNDLQRGIPFAYLVPILKTDLTEEKAERSYSGYAYTLQFLWYILLGEKKFKESKLKNLHQAHEIYPIDASEESTWSGFEPVGSAEILWASLDRYFGIIKNEIIEPMEYELKKKTNYNNLLDSLLLCQNFDKIVIENYLVKHKLKDPEYFSKEDIESVYKKLDYYFLWYKTDVLDGSNTSIFNGVPAFNSILIGNVYKKKYYGNNERVLI